MRNRTDVFLDALETYLKAYFSKMAIQEGLQDIVEWDRGYAVLNSLEQYPAAVLLCPRKTYDDEFSGKFDLILGIAVTGDDPVMVNQQGFAWFDIVEDALRADSTLGGSCLQTYGPAVLENDCVDNVFLIQARFTCEVDLGGLIEARAEEKPEEVQEVRISDTEHESSSVSEMWEGTDNSNFREEEHAASI